MRFRSQATRRLLKTPSESFDAAQDERRGLNIIEDLSVHAEALEAFRTFFSNPLGEKRVQKR